MSTIDPHALHDEGDKVHGWIIESSLSKIFLTDGTLEPTCEEPRDVLGNIHPHQTRSPCCITLVFQRLVTPHSTLHDSSNDRKRIRSPFFKLLCRLIHVVRGDYRSQHNTCPSFVGYVMSAVDLPPRLIRVRRQFKTTATQFSQGVLDVTNLRGGIGLETEENDEEDVLRVQCVMA